VDGVSWPTWQVTVTATGYQPMTQPIDVHEFTNEVLDFALTPL